MLPNIQSINIKEAIALARDHLILAETNNASPWQLPLDCTREAESILCLALKKNRAFLRAFDEQLLETKEIEHFFNLIHQRAQGIPFAYLSGIQEFWGLELIVTQDTLIPRADTECIIEAALNKLERHASLNILDLGTGSGAIACALQAEFYNAKVIACDSSLAALQVAKKNAERHTLNIEFIQSNWFSNIRKPPLFDLICSNPPYLDESDPHLQYNGLNFEPRTALVAKEQGLDDLFTIIQQATHFLKPQGFLMLEHGYQQANNVHQHFQQIQFSNIETIKDYNDHDRITLGQYL